ncbi:hypothetical protein V8D89_008937 [Ganoderma adspersum]
MLSITMGSISVLFSLATLASLFDGLAILVLYPLSGMIYSNVFLTLLNVRKYMAGIWDNSNWAADWNTIHPSQIPDIESFQPSMRSAGQAAPVSIFLESHIEGINDSDGLKIKAKPVFPAAFKHV